MSIALFHPKENCTNNKQQARQGEVKEVINEITMVIEA